jgi:voltage-gated potassium channel
MLPERVRGHLTTLGEALYWPVAFLALLVIPALIMEDGPSPELHRVALAINWFVWFAFCAEFLILWAARPSWTTVRRAWLDVVLILISPPFLVPQYLQATRSLRMIRALRVLRLMRMTILAGALFREGRRFLARRQFHFVVAVAVGMVLLGALGIFVVEKDSNPAIHSFGDAVWWAIVTATTVGYGDVSPNTLEGRVIAVILMLTGIGVIGIFTATVASFFFGQDHSPSMADLSARLDAIEKKLDELVSRTPRP